MRESADGTTVRGASRRTFGRVVSALGFAVAAGQEILPGRLDAAEISSSGRASDPKIRGAILIMNTPYTDSGAVDFDSLADEVRFINRCGGKTFVWGQLEPYIDEDERMRAMEVVMKANAGQKALVGLGVQGRDIPEMLKFAKHAEALGPDMIISRPPESGRSQEDYRAYYRALAAVTKRPVIIQTSGGGGEKLPPSTDLIIDLAREFPNFGYVKEEAPVGRPREILARHRELLAHRPPMRSVLSANYGLGLLYEMRIGIDGVVTGSAMYTDVLTRIWELHEKNQEEALREAYGRYLLMRNVTDQIPSADLYVWKKRGVYKSMATRRGVRGGKPGEYSVDVPKFSDADIAEIEYRLAGLKPYMAKDVA